MGKAEEQLRGASALMLELQRGLAEVQQPPTQPPQRVPAGAAPSTLPREDAYESRPDFSVLHPGRGISRHTIPPWNAGPKTLDTGQPVLAGGARSNAGSNAGIEEWQGGGMVNVRTGAMGGAVGAGGVAALRQGEQGEVVDGEYPVYGMAGRTTETHIEGTAIASATDASGPLQIEVYRGISKNRMP